MFFINKMLQYLQYINYLKFFRKYVQPIIHSMVLIGLAVLVVFVVVLMFYVSWMKFEDSNEQNTPMDFVLFGPQKYTSKFYYQL
jgi:TRAP-type C4-dicarboxylate transport system permease small subunit